MKQEWRLQGKRPRLDLAPHCCGSVLPLGSALRLCLDWSLLRLGLHGSKAGEEPARQGAARVTVAGAEGERGAHSDLAQVP